MAVFTISGDRELMSRLEKIATGKGMSVETLVHLLLEEYVAEQASRRDDPIIGVFDSGKDDIVANVEDILHNEWNPD